MCILFILDEPKCNDIQQPLFSSHDRHCPASINKRQCRFSQWRSLVRTVKINIHNFQHHRGDIHNMSDGVTSLCTNVICDSGAVIYGGTPWPQALTTWGQSPAPQANSVGLAITDLCSHVFPDFQAH